jgi:hypothetical protein
MNEYVERGTANAQRVVARVLDEVPVDRIARGDRLAFAPWGANHNRVAIGIPHPDGGPKLAMPLHRNGLQQVSARVGLPFSWADETLAKGSWGAELVAHNLTTLAEKGFEPGRRLLLRSVHEEVRGVLSDRFRRIDSRPIVDMLLDATQKSGLVPKDGVGSDTRVSLRFIRPEIMEPLPGEFMVYGFSWTNSDFGRGANELQSFLLRLVCINGAVAATKHRSVHLGGRLDDESIRFSERTIRLDSAAILSAVKDTVHALMLPEKAEEHGSIIQQAHEQRIEPKELQALLKKHLNKTETKEVTDAFNSPDVEMLPPGQNRWRLSNALSFVARDAEPDKRIDLERLAGLVLA